MSTYNVALTEDVKNFTITIDGDTRIFQIADGVGPQGATEWNELTGTLDILPFTTTNGGPQNQGELAWDSAEETLSLQLAHGTILQLGEETLYHVENVTGSNIADGTPVSYAGTVGNSGKMRVKPWNGATDDPLIFMGIATSDIETDDSGYVTHFGKVRGINTNAYTAGAVLYANPSGTGLTMTQPTTGQYVIAAVCVSSANNGTLFVRPTRYGGANWDAIGGKPSTFAPSAHTHPASEISDSTTTGRSLMTAANAAAARTTLELGNAALTTTSTGGNGSADSGKVLAFGADGSIKTTKVTVQSSSGLTGLVLNPPTSSFAAPTFVAGSYTVATTQSAFGIPDNIAPSLEKTTPVDADETIIRDSAAVSVAKRLTFANLWTWITTKLGANVSTLTIGGPVAYSSTTRPTSAGTGTPASNSLINLDDMRQQIADPANVLLVDEFIGGNFTSGTIGDLGWSRYNAGGGTGAGVGLVAMVAWPNIGVRAITSGNAVQSATTIHHLLVQNLLQFSGWQVTATVALSQTTDCDFIFGFTKSSALVGIGEFGGRSFGVRYSSAFDTNFMFYSKNTLTDFAANDSNNYAVSSGVAVGTGYNTFRIRSLVAGQLQMSINGGSWVAVQTSSISTSGSFLPFFYIASRALDNKSIIVDFWSFEAAGLSR